MSVATKVEYAELQRRAQVHAQAIEQCNAALADNARALSEAQTLGPLYHQVKAAVGETVAKREEALRSELRRHEAMREALLASLATTSAETVRTRRA